MNYDLSTDCDVCGSSEMIALEVGVRTPRTTITVNGLGASVEQPQTTSSATIVVCLQCAACGSLFQLLGIFADNRTTLLLQDFMDGEREKERLNRTLKLDTEAIEID